MRRIFIPSGLEERIEEARLSTDFETWVLEACQQRLLEARTLQAAIGEGMLTDLHVAVVEDGWEEAILLWRCYWPGVGDTMLPIIARDEQAIEGWNELIALELNMMPGPAVRWRRWNGTDTERLEYLRAPEVEDPD